MLYNICGFIVISFAAVGIIDLYKTLSLALYCPKVNNSITIIPIGNDSNNTEFIVRCAITKSRWLNTQKNHNIICLDCGMNEESKTICSKLCDKYPFLSIMTSKELKEKISSFESQIS